MWSRLTSLLFRLLEGVQQLLPGSLVLSKPMPLQVSRLAHPGLRVPGRIPLLSFSVAALLSFIHTVDPSLVSTGRRVASAAIVGQPGLDSFRPSTEVYSGSFGGHQAGPLKGPDLVLQGTSQRSLVVACRLHDFLGATSPISGRAGPCSLSAALPPTLSCVEEPMMIQPESLGLPPSVVVVPQGSLQDLLCTMR